MMQVAGVLQKPYLRIDPRTKFFLLFFVGVLTFAFPPVYFEVAIVLVLCLLLALNHQIQTAVTAFIVFTLMLAMDIWLVSYIPGVIQNIFFTIVRLGRMLLPLFLVGALMMRTTTVSEFIAAFRKMHLPDAVIIPFSVMFRFIPTVSEEWHSIRNAMRFRGIDASAKNILTKPLTTLEYTLIPLLMSTATIAGELAAASLARGLDSEGERTCIVDVRFRVTDYFIILGCLSALVCWVVTKG